MLPLFYNNSKFGYKLNKYRPTFRKSIIRLTVQKLQNYKEVRSILSLVVMNFQRKESSVVVETF